MRSVINLLQGVQPGGPEFQQLTQRLNHFTTQQQRDQNEVAQTENQLQLLQRQHQALVQQQQRSATPQNTQPRIPTPQQQAAAAQVAAQVQQANAQAVSTHMQQIAQPQVQQPAQENPPPPQVKEETKPEMTNQQLTDHLKQQSTMQLMGGNAEMAAMIIQQQLQGQQSEVKKQPENENQIKKEEIKEEIKQENLDQAKIEENRMLGQQIQKVQQHSQISRQNSGPSQVPNQNQVQNQQPPNVHAQKPAVSQYQGQMGQQQINQHKPMQPDNQAQQQRQGIPGQTVRQSPTELMQKEQLMRQNAEKVSINLEIL